MKVVSTIVSTIDLNDPENASELSAFVQRVIDTQPPAPIPVPTPTPIPVPVPTPVPTPVPIPTPIPVPVSLKGKPVLNYQDFLSSPVGGYISLFGENLAGVHSVMIGGVAQTIVDNTTGTRIDIQVTANTPINPSAISLVMEHGGGLISNLTAFANIGKVTHVPLNGGAQAAVNAALPGDQIILDGGIWTENNGRYDSFFSLQDGHGGTKDAPIMVRGMIGQLVQVHRAGRQHGIHLWNSPGGLAVSGIKIDMQGGGTPFGWPPGAAHDFGNMMQNIRAVDNEFTGMVGKGGGSAAMEGRGRNIKYLGNRVHDNRGDKLYHGIYFDDNDLNGTDDIEIAWNIIWNQGGGRGIQIYNAGHAGISNVNVHHNVVHDIALDGILFGDSTTIGMTMAYNVVYRCAVKELQVDGSGGGCLRFNNSSLVAEVHHNTLVDGAMDNDIDSGNVRFQSWGSIGLRDNIIVCHKYIDGTPDANVLASGNIWFGDGPAPAFDHTGLVINPLFVDAMNHNYALLPESPVIGKGAL